MRYRKGRKEQQDGGDKNEKQSQWGTGFQAVLQRETERLSTAHKTPIVEIGGLQLETPVPRQAHNRPRPKYYNSYHRMLDLEDAGQDAGQMGGAGGVRSEQPGRPPPARPRRRPGEVGVVFAGLTDAQLRLDRLTITSGF